MREIIGLLFLIAAVPFGFAALRIARQSLAALITRKEQEQRHADVSAPRAIITLVHGTFAKGAPWTRPGSRLAQALTKRFGPECKLQHQDWSGHNSFGARAEGADKVVQCLEVSRTRHPETPHYLIGHSHGGNVALQAAMNLPGQPLDGIICLATPVLTTKRRRFSRRLRIIIGIGFFLLLAMPFYSFDDAWEPTDLESFATFICIGLAVGWYRWAQAMARKVCIKRPYYKLDPDRVTFVRSPFDEASGIIGLVNFITWLVNRIIAGPFALYEYFVRGFTLRQRLLSIIGYTALFLLAAILDLVVDETPSLIRFRAENQWFEVSEFIVIGVSALMGVTGAFLAAFAPALHRLRNNRIVWWVTLPFTLSFMVIGAMLFVPAIVLMSFAQAATVGLELLVCSVFVEVTAEPCPTGKWQLSQLRPPPEGALRHSSVYDSDAGIAAIIAALERNGLEPVPEQI